MKWDMEIEEIEAVLEKIWNLHDKLSNAIHSISRAHFLNSIKALIKSDKKKLFNDVGDDKRNGSMFIIICKMEGIVVRRVIPSDNSCLFNVVGYVMDHDKTKAPELRQVMVATVSSDPTKYSKAFLGKPNAEYCAWILDSDKWGAYDIQTTRCDLYGQEKNYSERVMLIYDGLHYDALAEMDIGSLDIGDFLDSVCTLQVLSQDETLLLYIMVFGESVVNDITSVALFNAIQTFVPKTPLEIATFCGVCSKNAAIDLNLLRRFLFSNAANFSDAGIAGASCGVFPIAASAFSGA
ncbi:Detected protein of confused Function [Hibiscus syriacus]|uniref:Ubiquitin thioesterase OTU n=1 Tax=Hibiscus syriacus TaxID=106335 RepID=A0A6A3BKN7_HIBSY|nr:Detected protein of confused Function [Hibiscus syriacus]